MTRKAMGRIVGLAVALAAMMVLGCCASAEQIETLPLETVVAEPVVQSPAPEQTPPPETSALTDDSAAASTPANDSAASTAPANDFAAATAPAQGFDSASSAEPSGVAAPSSTADADVVGVRSAPASAGGWLMSDVQGEATLSVGGIFSGGSTVLGSAIPRSAITSIRFESSVAGAPATAWDVSAARNGSVLAWVSDEGALTIASEGGVRAGMDCSHLFAGYASVTRIDFNNCFYTDEVVDMSHMFESCWSLGELDVSSLNTSKVQDMSYMFSSCSQLETLDLTNLRTGGVVNMEGMFLLDEKLSALDLSSFDTRSVKNMRSMFEGCAALTRLDLSGFRLVSVTDVRFMFSDCAALREIDFHIDLFIFQPEDENMLNNCPATLIVGGRSVNGQTWATLADCARLTLWSRGDKVRWLQSRLADEGFSPGNIDGVFGRGTEAALRAWQAANGYEVTGRPNLAQVWALLN